MDNYDVMGTAKKDEPYHNGITIYMNVSDTIAINLNSLDECIWRQWNLILCLLSVASTGYDVVELAYLGGNIRYTRGNKTRLPVLFTIEGN